MSDQPLISFSIVSWNVRAYLGQCLRSIERYVDTSHEVIVVDNASSDDSVDMVRREFPAVEVVTNTRNQGFAAANNQALARARGQFIVVLNPDTEFFNNPFPVLVEYLQQHPNCACVAPEILHTDHTHQQSVRVFPRLADQVVVLLKLRHFLAHTRTMRRYLADPGSGQKHPLAVDQVMGACMVIPGTQLQRIGDFDPGYPNWFEEVDWCQRAKRAGQTVVYHPGAQIIHHGGQSFGQVVSLKKQRWFNTGLRRYARRYWSGWSQVLITCLTPINLVLSALQTLVIRY